MNNDTRYIPPETVEVGRGLIIDGEREAFFKWAEKHMPHVDIKGIRLILRDEKFWNKKECPPSGRNELFVKLVGHYHSLLDQHPIKAQNLFDHLVLK